MSSEGRTAWGRLRHPALTSARPDIEDGRRAQARPHPPARRQRAGRPARRLARRARARLRDRPLVARRLRCPTRSDYAFVASLGHDQGPATRTIPPSPPSASCSRVAVARDVPVLGLCYGGQVLAAVLGARGRAGAGGGARAGARSRPTIPSSCPSGPWLEWHFERFCTPPGATELARTADAPQAFRLGPHLGVQFHPEATVEIVAGLGARRRGAARGARASTTARRCSTASPERRAAARGGGLPALRRLPRRSNRPIRSKGCRLGDLWYGPARNARVRLRLLLVRVQGGLPPPLRGVLEPGQDALLAGRRRRPRHRPPRGLPVLGHGGPAADRPAPQRRDVQPRPPQSRADRRARAGDGPLRHRQPPLPGARPHRARRGARGHLPAEHAARHLRLGRRRGDRHRDQDRPPHAPAAQDRLDPQGLPRPHGARGGDRRRPLLDAVPLRPPGRVRPGPVQRPRRDGGGARAAATSPAW